MSGSCPVWTSVLTFWSMSFQDTTWTSTLIPGFAASNAVDELVEVGLHVGRVPGGDHRERLVALGTCPGRRAEGQRGRGSKGREPSETGVHDVADPPPCSPARMRASRKPRLLIARS